MFKGLTGWQKVLAIFVVAAAVAVTANALGQIVGGLTDYIFQYDYRPYDSPPERGAILIGD